MCDDVNEDIRCEHEFKATEHATLSLPLSSSPEIKSFNVQLIFRDVFSANNELSFCVVTWEKFSSCRHRITRRLLAFELNGLSVGWLMDWRLIIAKNPTKRLGKFIAWLNFNCESFGLDSWIFLFSALFILFLLNHYLNPNKHLRRFWVSQMTATVM